MKRRCNIKCNDASNHWWTWTLLTGGSCVLSRHSWTLLLCLGSKFTHTWPGCLEQFTRYKGFSLKATTNLCLRVRPSRCLTGSWSLHVSYRLYVQCYRFVPSFLFVSGIAVEELSYWTKVFKLHWCFMPNKYAVHIMKESMVPRT